MNRSTIWLEMSRKDFVDAIKRLKPARMLKQYLGREIQIGLINGEAAFCVNGAQTRRVAKGEWQGFVCFNYGHAFSLTKVQPVNDPVRLEFAEDRLSIESFKMPATWVEASEWITEMNLEAHFHGPEQEAPVETPYCPKCGKRSGGFLATLPVKPKPSAAEKAMYKLRDQGQATHGCSACGYAWIGIGYKTTVIGQPK